ncbi:MAG: sugar phosphate nucleotidyltransferase [Thermodesulfobacteriota bacterium]
MHNQGVKALLLSAGRGTRLLPHTRKLPKPLFPVAGRPVIDIIIWRLIEQGISAIAVNTHHLHQQVESFISSQSYPVPVVTRYEPEMLGTAGAIANFSDFLGNRDPFVVMNSDILTDIDIKGVVDRHRENAPAATLVVHDCPEFNKVRIDKNGLIKDFSGHPEKDECCLAFTGIQVIDPVIYKYIPKCPHADSIDVYRSMIGGGLMVMAWKSFGHYWHDIGTPERYCRAVAGTLSPAAFEKAFKTRPGSKLSWQQLAGDGSDRRWFRLKAGGKSLVMADHGIQSDREISEFDSFVSIGSHLHKQGISVPEIHLHDRFSGLVFIEDLGDISLQSAVLKTADPEAAETLYRQAIDRALDMSIKAARGFDPAWCYQEPAYGRDTIVEKEGMYFAKAFIDRFLAMKDFDNNLLYREFERLADVIEACGTQGFMHRDLQSRNIMVNDRGCFFIDFQGARRGPVQYDLASLITDAYVDLEPAMRRRLLEYAADRLEDRTGGIDKTVFYRGYHYCAIARNLQALGAFGHLTGARHKPQFAGYMKPALKNLSALLARTEDPSFPCLADTVSRAEKLLRS